MMVTRPLHSNRIEYIVLVSIQIFAVRQVGRRIAALNNRNAPCDNWSMARSLETNAGK